MTAYMLLGPILWLMYIPDEDLAELGELNLDELDKKVDQKMAEERHSAAHAMTDEDMILPPPFPELAYLDLSRNKVRLQWLLLLRKLTHD